MPSDSAQVLTSSEIRNIRRYVQYKYADLPTERRAEIIADAMQRIVIRQPPAFPDDMKSKLTDELLRHVVAAQQLPVGAAHIFDVCLASDSGETVYRQPFREWTEKKLGIALNSDQFSNILEEAVSAMRVPEAGRTPWRIVTERASKMIADRLPLPPTGKPVQRRVQLPARGGAICVGSQPRASIALPNPINLPIHRTVVYALLSVFLIGLSLFYSWPPGKPDTTAQAQRQPAEASANIPEKIPEAGNGLPAELRYVAVNEERLLEYLRGKSSLLAEEPYFEAIMAAARNNNIDPLLLFAITGQEQGFVPKKHKQAKKIANNPFNVFYSWQEYNTSITKSSVIAAHTILRISKERPEGADAIAWINREYAEDPNWSKGVSSILKAMRAFVGQSD